MKPHFTHTANIVFNVLYSIFRRPSRQAAASKGMHVGKLLASWRGMISIAVHVAHADNVSRGLSVAADGVEAVCSSVGMPSP
jgi:hypothetical protein